jgi:transcriptional repressor NrdR
MHCPSCYFEETKVIDSRPAIANTAIRRRRECLKCGFRFSTYEQIEILDLTVIKKTGKREPYQKMKVEAGVRKALEKRPFSEEDILSLIANIERDIQVRNKDEITSAEIGDIIMKHLRQADQVAYIRFASVYKDFQDIESFEQELNEFLNKRHRLKTKKKTRP